MAAAAPAPAAPNASIPHVLLTTSFLHTRYFRWACAGLWLYRLQNYAGNTGQGSAPTPNMRISQGSPTHTTVSAI